MILKKETVFYSYLNHGILNLIKLIQIREYERVAYPCDKIGVAFSLGVHDWMSRMSNPGENGYLSP